MFVRTDNIIADFFDLSRAFLHFFEKIKSLSKRGAVRFLDIGQYWSVAVSMNRFLGMIRPLP